MSLILGFLKKLTVTQWIVTGLIVLIIGQHLKLAMVQHNLTVAVAQERQSHLGQLNAEALLDTTRKRAGSSLKGLNDSLDLFRRKVVQETQKRSALDRELGDAAVANYRLLVRVDSMVAGGMAPVIVAADSLKADFNVRQPPYHVTASVALPQQGTGRINLGILQDPLALSMRVGCGPLVRGIREANVSMTAPHYATLRLDSLSQSPEVCSPPPAVKKSSGWFKAVLVGLAGMALGKWVF